MYDPLDLDQRLAELHRGRRFVLAVDVAAGVTPFVPVLRRWGVDDILLIARWAGAGDLPDIDFVPIEVEPGGTLSEGLQRLGEAFASPPPQVAELVDAFDPIGEAGVITPPFLRRPGLFGRRTMGARPDNWRRLEDKTLVDDIWERSGVPAAPVALVEPAEASEAAVTLATDLGTVWSADNTRGWHGANDGTRWVPDGEAARRVAGELGWAKTVRVMPFLDGIPCSIHGIVTAGGVAVTRPAEILILRDHTSQTFSYAGVASTWDPPDVRRSEMRSVARRVGRQLATEVGYRGAFGIDGVLTEGGFRPTELNPRFTAGLMRIAHGLQAVDLGSLDRAIVDRDIELDAEALEQMIVTAADARRHPVAGMVVPDVLERESVGIHLAGDDVSLEEGGIDGTVSTGPIAGGTYLRLAFDPDSVPIGPSLAPLVLRTLRAAANRWGFELPDLVPAPDLR